MSESEDEEYVVEEVLEAKVYKKSKGKVVWKYLVKWKGYDGPDDNTYEPIESFKGAEHFITGFWKQARLDGKDWEDPADWVAHEVVAPAGPAKKKPGRKSGGGRVSPPADEDNESEQETEPEKPAKGKGRKQPGRKSGGRSSAIVDKEDESEPEAEPKKPVTGNGRNKPRRKAGRDIRPPSPPVDEDNESEQEAELEKPAKSKWIKKPSSDVSTEPPARRGRPPKAAAPKTYAKSSRRKSMPNTGKTQPVASSSKKRKFEVANEPDEEPALTVPLTKTGPPKGAKKRVRRELVKEPEPVLDDPPHQDLEPTEVERDSSPAQDKRRLSTDSMFSSPAVSRPAPRSSGIFSTLADDTPSDHDHESDAVSAGEKVALPSTTPARRLPSHRERAANPRIKMMDEPELGETSTSAISVKVKLSLKKTATVTKSPAASTSQLARSTHKAGPGRSSLGLIPADSEPMQGVVEDEIQDADDIAGFSIPETTASLKEMVAEAAKAVEADALEDFVDEPMEVETEVQTTVTEEVFPELSPAKPTNSILKRPTLTGPTSKFGDSSIFGMLSYSSSSSKALVQDTFPLNLDSVVSVPVVLKDVNPVSKLDVPSLENIIIQGPHPPGKFYAPESWATLFKTFGMGGPSARFVLEKDTNETASKHFTRFRERLNNSDIFLVMAGVNMLVVVASTNQQACEELEIPESLRGLADEVICSAVVIKDHSGYASAVMASADARWS